MELLRKTLCEDRTYSRTAMQVEFRIIITAASGVQFMVVQPRRKCKSANNVVFGILPFATALLLTGCTSDQGVSDPNDIHAVQQLLAVQGYESGSIDGTSSAATAAAIRRYQADWQLDVTGRITNELISRLERTHPETKSRWQKLDNLDCTVWNRGPAARETLSWSGACVDGRISGEGVLLSRHLRNSIWNSERHDGAFRDGHAHGRGILEAANGDRYDGDFHAGQPDGHGSYLFARGDLYVGEILDGAAHGNGVVEYANSDRYEGSFRLGAAHGSGEMSFADGSRYVGEFRDSKPDGRGAMTFADGGSYVGGFRNGAQNGRGVMKLADGTRHVGGFRDGRPHGFGVMKLPDGTRFDGEFRSGVFEGKGVMEFANGDRYEGEFRDSKPNGHGVFLSVNGDRYEGDLRGGLFDGRGVVEFADGTRYEGQFRDSTPHGNGAYYKDSEVFRGSWENGCFKAGDKRIAIGRDTPFCR